jgi:tetratricopeptide (TPR) repeat protein
MIKTIVPLMFLFILNETSAQLEQGISAVKKGDYLTALSLLRNASKNSYEANLYYGIALFRTGSLKDAEKFLKDAIKKDSERPEAYSVLGEIYTAQKKFNEAVSEFQKARKYLPLDKSKDQLDKEEIEVIISVLTAEAESFIADGKVDNAISSLTQARTYDDKNPMIYTGLGDAYLYRGAFEPARTNYEQALKLKPNFAPALYGLGKIDFKQKKYSSSLENFIKSTEADNNFAPAFFERGLIFYLLDRFNDAIDAFSRYDQLMPGSSRGKTYLAKAHYGKGEIDVAMGLLEQVLSADPSYSEANKYYAYCLIDRKDYSEAESYFNKVNAEDLNAEDYYKWSKIYLDKKEFAKAYELLDMAVSKDPEDPNVFFEYGKTLFNEQKYPEALDKFRKSIELGIVNVAAYIYAGICEYYLKNYAGGVEFLTRSIELNPNVGSAYLWRANCYASDNRNKEAIEDYRKYLEFEPGDEFALEQIKKLGGN